MCVYDDKGRVSDESRWLLYVYVCVGDREKARLETEFIIMSLKK